MHAHSAYFNRLQFISILVLYLFAVFYYFDGSVEQDYQQVQGNDVEDKVDNPDDCG